MSQSPKPSLESNQSLPSLDEFKRLSQMMAQEEMRELRRNRRKGIPKEALLWLALSPGWTLPLAKACELPGVRSHGLQELFERLLEEELLRAYPLSDEVSREGDEFYYAMTPEARSEILQERLSGLPDELPDDRSPKTQGDKVLAARKLLDLTAEIAIHMQAQITALDYLPAALKRWVDLAIHARKSEELVQTFNQFIQKAYSDRDLAAIQDWVQAARWLTPLYSAALDLDLQLAIIQAGRFIELIRRRSHDAVHLAHFWRRDEQIRAVRQLMGGSDQAWALHFIGAGGVGKTTLIRYITCMVNAVQGDPCYGDEALFDEELALARIDFDYLNPDFPRLHPGLLLNALAQELRAYAPASGPADEYFSRAEEAFEELHQALKSRGYHPDQPPTSDGRFQRGLRYYIDALHALGKRVLIILDTCEELEKATPLNMPNANVQETFRILRALHDGPETLVDESVETGRGLPRLRVILSGRRLLAGGGLGWSSPETRQPRRDYLRLFWVRGFTRKEASAYLAQESVPKDLIPVVIQVSSPDAGSAVRFEIEEQPADDDASQRCNPYQLNDFMSWALEESPPTPQQLLDARGSYTQVRIVERLRDTLVKGILPKVVWLGHFDQELLGVATGLSGGELAAAFERLQEQEWVERRVGLEIARPILSLNKTTRDQLHVYYTDGEKDLVSFETRRRVQAFTRKWIEDRDLGELEWTDYDAALRVFEADFESGAEWWRQVEVGLFAGRDPQRIIDTLSVLIGKDGSASLRPADANPDTPSENRLRPHVLATLAAAHLQAGDFGPLTELWDVVISKARQMALNGGARATWNLYRRALAGRATLSRFNQLGPDYRLPGWFWEAWSTADEEDLADPQLAAAWIAGCEGLVEYAENQAGDPYGLDLGLVTQLDASPVIQALGWAACNMNRKGGPEAEQLLSWAVHLAGQQLIASERYYAVQTLVDDFVELGQIDRAYQTVNALPDLYYRCRALCSLASHWGWQENDEPRRLQAARQALTLAQRLSKSRRLGSSSRAVEVLCEAASALHAAGENLEVIQQTLQNAQTMALELQDENERADALADVLEVYRGLERSEDRVDVPQPLLAALLEFTDERARKKAVNYLASFGQVDTARDLAGRIQDAALRGEALSRVVEGLVEKGAYEAALELAQQISDLPWRWRARLNVSRRLRQLGEEQQNEGWVKLASDLLESCLAELSQVPDSVVRDDLLEDAADELLYRGQKGRILALAAGMRSREALDRVWILLAREEIYGGDFSTGLQFAGRVESSAKRLTLLSEMYQQEPDKEATQLLAECLELARDLYSRASAGSGSRLLASRLSEAGRMWQDVQELPPESGQSLLAFGYTLAARGLTLAGDVPGARDLWTSAIAALPSEMVLRNPWMDWRPPPDLAIRLQLDLARTACPALFSPQEVLEMLAALPGSRPGKPPVFSEADIPPEGLELDVDRQSSIRLALRLASGLVEAGDLVELDWASKDNLTPIYYEDVNAPEATRISGAGGTFETSSMRLWLTPGDCNAQRRIPPLLVTACQAWAALGQVDFAAHQLRYLANSDFFDLQVREHAERALLGLIRRGRLFEIGQETATSLQTALDINDLGLVWSVEVLSGQRRGWDVRLETSNWIDKTLASPLHHAWRSMPAVRAFDQVECIEFGLTDLTLALVEGQVHPSVDYAWAALALDLLELQRMAAPKDGWVISHTGSSSESAEKLSYQRSALGLDGKELWQLSVERGDQNVIWQIHLGQETFRYPLDVSAWAMAHPMQPEAILRLAGRQLALAEAGPSDQPGYTLEDFPDGLLIRLGARRAGHALYEEAEMLAQRLPGAAAGLFGLAQECFRQADDLQGQFLAGMSQALAYAYEESAAGQNETWKAALNRSLEATNPLYEHLRQRPGLREMPAWSELEKLATKPRLQSLNDLAPPGWKPWLARSVACLARQCQLSGRDVNLSGLQEWLSRRYSVDRAALEGRLPGDWLAFYEAPDGEDWITLVLGAIGILVMLGFCVGGFFLFRSLAGFTAQASLWVQIAWYIGLGFALLVALGGSNLVWKSYARRRSFLEIVLSLQTPDQFKELIVNPEAIYSEQRPLPFDAILTRWHPRWRLAWPLLHLVGEPVEQPFQGQATFTQPYAGLAELLPEKTRQRLDRIYLQDDLSKPHRVALSIGDGLHGLAWEALLEYNLEENDRPDTPLGLPSRFERVVHGDYGAPGQSQRPLRIASLVGDALSEEMAEAGAQGLGIARDFVWVTSQMDTSERASIWGVHLIGSVQISYNRLGVRLESGYEQQISVSQSKAPGDSDRLLTARELISTFPQMRLCIVQNLVSGLKGPRMETARLDASLARVFAAQAAGNGAAVLVLPPLPSSLALEALKIVAAALPQTPRQGSAALRQAVAEVQEIVIKGIPDHDTAWEVAMDVCLYVPEGWHVG